MSSRREQSNPGKKPDESARRKQEDKNKSQKEAYKKKNYKSSPSLPPSAAEKVVLFQCTASTKQPNIFDPSSSQTNATKHVKGKNPDNSQTFKSDVEKQDRSKTFHMQKKNVMPGNTSNVSFQSAKNNSNNIVVQPQNVSACSQFVSPQSMVPQSQQPKFDQTYKFALKLQHNKPENLFKDHHMKTKQLGSNRFPKPEDSMRYRHFSQNAQSVRFPKPDNQHQRGICAQQPFGSNKFPEREKNMRYRHFSQNAQSVRFTKPDNQHQRGICAQQPFARNQMPVMHKPATSNSQHPNVHVHFPHNKQHEANMHNKKLSVPSVKKTTTPVISSKKKKPDSKSNSGSERKEKSFLKKKNRKINHFKMKMKESSNTNAVPLLSFHCGNAVPDKNLDLIQFDDEDEEGSIISELSVDNVTDLIEFSEEPSCSLQSPVDCNLIDLSEESYQPVDTSTQIFSGDEIDSDSSDESLESDVVSEFSVDSSILSSESRLNILKPNMTKEAYISVFWDIENCSLPSKKSAVDFASYVRDTFYEGRTEVQFTAACDVSNLSSVFVRELDEAAITLIHISSVNKNAADKKIQGLLQKFQLQYRMSNSAVVMITSDSDFSQFLLDMRYQHHIFVNLICKKEVRDSLTTAANKFVFFDDIIIELPDRNAKSNFQYVLFVTNLPQLDHKQIKNCLSEKLSSFNCRICINASSAKIVFKDHSVCEKAMNSLKGYYLGGNSLQIAYKTEPIEIVSKEEKKPKNSLLSTGKTIKKTSVSENLLPDFEEHTVLNSSNAASLSIFVSTYLGDVEHWRKIFENNWKTTEFSIKWEGNLLDGFLLVNFGSLKKAQKVKKILQKNQINDPEAPKFMKLLKNNKDLVSTEGNGNSSEDPNMKKIDECVQIIEKKKLKFLRKHESFMNEIKIHSTVEDNEASGAITDKLRECEEQKQTFINFSNVTINIIKSLYRSENVEIKLKDMLCDFTRECNSFSSALPIYAKKETILKGIKDHQVTIIRAETGSGKSTQLTQYIWRDKYVCRSGKIICTQPRKIAAISLAKYVSSQIGCKLGDVVGYQVGMSSKLSANTKIVYVTDFTMLKMLVGEDLNGISCIIIDEAHERTIYTDILIGMIKQYLPEYPHLKIIITSATIDTSIFRDYFTLTDSSVLQISGRTFPVDNVWLDHDITPDFDYFGKTIDKVFEILTEDPGDVLSFLTTPLETEKAVEKFSEKLRGRREEKKIRVFFLHGKMNSEEQQKVFEKASTGIRKVIFATNCAETSITIPGIKYVIDCGLVKESQYDAVRNMNVLSVGFVSKSSAEQRRGRAGRTQNGKCYRLFSKRNYDNMTNNTDPEILRINLGQALMKLMKMGVKNPLQFDFLQSPPKQQLTSAMDQLIYLKAVDENTFALTDLGNKMAILPLEPRLCHLIFQGFDSNIGYDCLVVAALITMSHIIFFRNSENKDDADRKKRRFCESENDFISYLEVYKEWADLPKNSKSQWCVINCINARSMRTVHELISEIIQILQKELYLRVKLKFNSDTYDTLIKTIFYSFSQNLSVFSGHPKCGYKCLNFPDRLLIHPSSSLYSFGQSTPKFVIYDTILKTSQTYMVNISPVTEEIILDAVKLHDLPIDLTAVKKLTGFEIIPSIFRPLGEKVIINNFIGKKGTQRRDLITKIKEFTNSDFVEIDIDVSNGSVKIFCLGNKYDEINSVVSPILNNAKQALRSEEKDLYLFEDRPFTAVMAAGGFIDEVVLPGEFKDLKVILKEEGNIESVIEKLSSCGSITETREWKKYFKVTFKTPASARNALSTYKNENDFVLQSIHKSLPLGRDHLYKVLMSFYRRPCVGVAYITVDNPVPQFLLPSSVTYDDVVARVSISKKTGDIRIMDLPLNTDRKVLESITSSILPSNIKITKCIISRKKPYESTIEEMESIKKNITGLFAEFTFKHDIEVFLKKPTAKDFTWNATVFIKNSHDGETAVNVLKSRKNFTNFLGGFILKPELQTYLYCRSEVFSVVKEEIQEALQFFKQNQPTGNELSINAVPKWTDTVEIKIMSNNIADITDARRFIHRILSGDKLNFLVNSSREKLFTNLGREFMRSLILNHQDCFILQNEYNKTITIFGKETSINVIKMVINEFLVKLENDDFKDLSLKTDSGKSIFKELLKKYGHDLQKLKEECNVLDISYIQYRQILTVRGNSRSVSKCESILHDIKKNIQTDSSEVQGEMCPICCDEVSEDKHRLEYCGHIYCTECLMHLFQNSEDIPLSCEVCHDPIVLVDIFWVLNGRNPLQKIVFEKFLHSFVARRKDISFCPSPDCTMIFRVTEESNIFRCPICGNSICTRCEDSYHYGMSCSLYKCLKSDSDYSLKVWMEEDLQNRKLCPKCSSPIEKNGGCSHMTCWKCKSHMCWPCMKVFPTGREVYDHQIYCTRAPV